MPRTEITKPTLGEVTPPSDIFTAMREEMDRMFERLEHGWPRWPSLISRRFGRPVMLPEVDVHEDDKQFMIEVDLPGVDEKDVSVTMANGTLTIKGEKKSESEEKEENYYLADVPTENSSAPSRSRTPSMRTRSRQSSTRAC